MAPTENATLERHTPVDSLEQRALTVRSSRRQNTSVVRRLGTWPLVILGATIGVFLSPVLRLATSIAPGFSSPDPTDYAARARHILNTVPLVDGHNDLPYILRVELQNKLYEGVNLSQPLLGHTDLSRMRKGQMGGQFWSVWIDCEPQDFREDPTSSVRDTLEQVDVAKRMIQQYSSTLHFCKESSCVRKAFRRGRIASMLAIEGGHQVGNSIASIRQFYDLGVRYITTTHNCDNAFATSASTVAKGSEDNGLSRFGYEYVKEMNRIGMMVDLSHVSHQTMRDVLSVTRAPVIFSHSGAYSVQKHLRHVPDDVLRNVQRNGGIVMVTFINRFLNMEDPDAANIGDVVDHVFHIARVAGWESVGVGGDYSGTPDTPVGLEDVSKYPELVAALLARGATDEQVRLFAGENILRVWKAVEDTASRIQAENSRDSLPSEAIWEGRIWTKGHSWLPFLLPGTKRRLYGGVKAERPKASDFSIKT